MSLRITDDPAADELLSSNPLALLIGMLLDQQVAMETAFAGPLKIQERTGSMDAGAIAHQDPDEFAAAFSQSPAVHRYPGSMAGRVQALCAAIEEDWDGKAENLWTRDDPDGKTVLKRLKACRASASRRRRSSSPYWASNAASTAPAGGRPRPLRRRGLVPLRGRHREPGVAHQGARAQARREGRGERSEGEVGTRSLTAEI